MKKWKKIKNKMKPLLEKFGEDNEGNNMDYINIKGILKQYNDAYEKFKNSKKKNDNENEDDNDDGIIFLTNYYNTLEEFIDKLDKNFDNETVLFKFYLYIKDLFEKYLEAIKLGLDK